MIKLQKKIDHTKGWRASDIHGSAYKSDTCCSSPSSIPRTHVKVEGKNWLHKVSCDLYTCAQHAHTCTFYIHTVVNKFIFKKIEEVETWIFWWYSGQIKILKERKVLEGILTVI